MKNIGNTVSGTIPIVLNKNFNTIKSFTWKTFTE